MGNVIISAEKLNKSYANEGIQNHVLNNINIEIFEKDFTAIMGASGSGKTTLLYCLSGIESFNSGKVTYKDRIISDYSEKQLVRLRKGDFGFVFQQIHMINDLTLFENIAVPGYSDKSRSVFETRKKAYEYMKAFGIEKAKKRLPNNTSRGEQQRASVARALINEPTLLFADEPTGALNHKSSVDVLDLLNKINRNGQSIIMATHDMEAAIRANRILYISDGSILDELWLPEYNSTEAQTREAQLNAWLSSFTW